MVSVYESRVMWGKKKEEKKKSWVKETCGMVHTNKDVSMETFGQFGESLRTFHIE
jgi:hypothetical protein